MSKRRVGPLPEDDTMRANSAGIGKRYADRDTISMSSEDSNNINSNAEVSTLTVNDGPLTARSSRSNISGQSDLDGSMERVDELRPNQEQSSAPASSCNASETELSAEKKEKGNDSNRLSASMDGNSISKNSKSGSDGKKKKGYWYNVLSPTYKSRSEEFKKLFKDIPNEERLLVDYSCALQKDILVQGRLYVTQNWICFYANIFRWETVLTVKCAEITSMTKEKTARVIPNAIAICTQAEKYFFTSFGARDKTFLMLFRVWQNALMVQPMGAQELWQWVHHAYGEELGLTSSDDDYIAPSQDDDEFAEKLQDDILPDKDASNEQEVYTNGDYSNGSNIMTMNAENAANSQSADEPRAPGAMTTASDQPTSTHIHVVTPEGTSADVITDPGETSDDEEEVCSGHEHERDGQYLNEVFNLNIDQLFNLIFTDTQFYTDFLKARKTFDLVQAPWPETADENGEKKREIQYTLSLNYSIGPKTSVATEKQKLLAQSKPGRIYVVEAECSQSGIPYADNFYVSNRYCLLRAGPTKTKFIVQSQIKFRKSVWGVVKNLIERNALQGMADNYRLMGEALRQQAEMTSPQGHGRKKMLRKRRPHGAPDRSPSLKRTDHQRSLPSAPISIKGSSTDDDWHIKLTTDSLAYVVCAILVVLLFCNLVLFYKLWGLENKATTIYKSSPQAFSDFQPKPSTQDDWTQLFEQQQRLHEIELDRWKDVLTASVKLVDQMKLTLADLLANIEYRTKLMAEAAQKQREH